MVPVRTCVGCRRRGEQEDVVRLALEGSQVVLDAARRKPGRGAWLHPRRSCFEAAISKRAFNRAFRGQVDVGHLSFEELSTVSGHGSPAEGVTCRTVRDESGIREMDTR